jgi:hypothetical protein
MFDAIRQKLLKRGVLTQAPPLRAYNLSGVPSTIVAP